MLVFIWMQSGSSNRIKQYRYTVKTPGYDCMYCSGLGVYLTSIQHNSI